MTDQQIEKMFREWWAQSYTLPPATHTMNTIIGWTQFLLQQINQDQQQKEQQR